MKSLKYWMRYAAVMLLCDVLVFADGDIIRPISQHWWGLLTGAAMGVAYAFGTCDAKAQKGGAQ